MPSAQSDIAGTLATEKTETGFVVKLPSAAFQSARADLSDEYREKLGVVGTSLSRHPRAKIVVVGHTDSSGVERNNIELSKRRAENVRGVLVEKGVNPENVLVVGAGSSKPIADNKTVEGRAQNRRVEVIVEGDISGENNEN